MKLKELLEEFKTTIKDLTSGEHYDIFVNPNSKEMDEIKKSNLYKSARYIIDFKRKKIYIFSIEVVHRVVADVLKIPYDEHGNKRYFFDGGLIQDGKILNASSGKRFKQEWMKKYFKFI